MQGIAIFFTPRTLEPGEIVFFIALYLFLDSIDVGLECLQVETVTVYHTKDLC